ncbi:hypothetical protein [Halomicrobium salinisoli]|uniref:hypothetical protein n=1 Tax=Halomicrobium salinisoli TaxID=2878391 RepID=UPI001CF01E22|nr:hypothetical protein [Halomicrobium salinisoli]
MLSITKFAGSVGRRFLGADDSDAEETDPEAAAEPRSALFHCPDCATVYIATDKTTCASCDTDVDQISATLTESA